MITLLESVYVPMTVKRVNNHTHMSVYMNFTERGTVKVSMTGYIDKSVDDFP